MTRDARRLTIVQYAGDFREAAERLARGGEETYRGQRYTVDYVERLAARFAAVTTVIGVTDTAYDITLPSGARAIGAGFRDRVDGTAIARLVADTRPDLLILRAPLRPVTLWALRNRCRTLMLLADSFNDRSLKSRLGRSLLTLLMRSDVFDVVANHGVRAARQLVAAGVAPGKVVAWDYPAFATPHDRPAKSASSPRPHLFYAGLLIAEKGVDDLIHAIRALHDRGVAATADLIGRGDDARIAALVDALGLRASVRLAGLVPNAEIIGRMAQADIVVVPSRHDYSEGLPLTIYEGYCSRTPLIVSDHPMFVDNVIDGTSGLVFPAGQPLALAERIERLAGDNALYARLSANGARAWEGLQIPVKWDVLIDRWLDGGDVLARWLDAHALAAGGTLQAAG